jgi:hypothetical protein
VKSTVVEHVEGIDRWSVTECELACCFHPNPLRERGTVNPSLTLFEVALF